MDPRSFGEAWPWCFWLIPALRAESESGMALAASRMRSASTRQQPIVVISNVYEVSQQGQRPSAHRMGNRPHPSRPPEPHWRIGHNAPAARRDFYRFPLRVAQIDVYGAATLG